MPASLGAEHSTPPRSANPARPRRRAPLLAVIKDARATDWPKIERRVRVFMAGSLGVRPPVVPARSLPPTLATSQLSKRANQKSEGPKS
jgi:hypothetical protein